MGNMALTEGDLGQPLTDAAIVERIVATVMQQKPAAGAKLPEAALCDAFDCSRTQIRRILVVLAERGVLISRANRGAFVASPNAVEAREVFEARRTIERSMVTSAADRIDAATLAELRANARTDGAAEDRGDRSESILLSGQFHLRLAETAGNSVMVKFLAELVARTSLIIGLYGSRSVRSCSEAEHEALIDALAARDGPRAAELMERHLRHIERLLDIRDDVETRADIRVVFAR
jgi:DNA-binding GntR family transcriptional regulator